MPHEKVNITTRDGVTDANVFTPEGQGPWPAIIMYTDILGSRPVFESMAARLAESGFAVLLPNQFYRMGPAPVALPEGKFGEPEFMQKLMVRKAALTQDLVLSDVAGLIEWLDARPEVAKSHIGIVGYCMSGAFAVWAAAEFPDRIAAAASFHGGHLATDGPDSPHLGAPRIKAKVLAGHATEDTMMPAEMIAAFEKALDAAGVRYESEVYPGRHGFAVEGGPAYDKPSADRHWERMTALFTQELAAR